MLLISNKAGGWKLEQPGRKELGWGKLWRPQAGVSLVL